MYKNIESICKLSELDIEFIIPQSEMCLMEMPDGNRFIFQSYNSKIVQIEGTWITFYKNYNYSVTTAKYRNKFLSDMLECDITSKDVEKMIKNEGFNGFNVTLINE